MDFAQMMKKPSAFVPIAMSLGAIATVVIHIVMFGIARQADEGTGAHIFQLLMAGQLPVIGFFALRWLPPFPKAALKVLVLQVAAAVAAFAPIYLLQW